MITTITTTPSAEIMKGSTGIILEKIYCNSSVELSQQDGPGEAQDIDVASIEPIQSFLNFFYRLLHLLLCSNLYKNFKKLCIGSMDATSMSCG